MLQNHATLQKARIYLLQELRKNYPETESSSISRIILDHAGYPLSSYFENPDQVIGQDTLAQINEIVSEIHTGKPIQYILGYTHFCDIKIKVNNNVLIPRPETEELVYKIIDDTIRPPGRILDIGTGSGSIALALKNHFSVAEVFALDVSREALKVASENGRINGLKVNWIAGDILHETNFGERDHFDLIVSNPPYVLNSERSMMSANVLEFEPGGALFVEDSDPLVFYRAIASYSMTQLNETGSVWVEINERFGVETARLFTSAGFPHVNIIKDIHEKERFIRAKK